MPLMRMVQKSGVPIVQEGPGGLSSTLADREVARDVVRGRLPGSLCSIAECRGSNGGTVAMPETAPPNPNRVVRMIRTARGTEVRCPDHGHLLGIFTTPTRFEIKCRGRERVTIDTSARK